MSTTSKITSQDEQDLCVSCGFCCDKTLFDVARLYDDEKSFENFTETDVEGLEGRTFMLPCVYFDCKCTIYNQVKPRICSKFKCKLLKKVIAGEIEKPIATKVILEAKRLRDDVVSDYLSFFGKKKPFRDIFIESFKDESYDSHPEKKIIKYKAHLLDILLSKEFKSKESFDQFYELLDEEV